MMRSDKETRAEDRATVEADVLPPARGIELAALQHRRHLRQGIAARCATISSTRSGSSIDMYARCSKPIQSRIQPMKERQSRVATGLVDSRSCARSVVELGRR